MLGAVNGFNEMMEYVENLMRKAVGYKLYITKEDSVADQICTYIDSHFREEAILSSTLIWRKTEASCAR